MKRLIYTLMITIITITLAASCTSRTEVAAIKDKYTPVLVLNDSITAINFKTLPGEKSDITVMTLQFTLNGESRTAVCQGYKNAYAMPDDSTEHDIQIGYFIYKKDIRK